MSEIEFDVSRDRYNAFVQDAQRDCIAFGMEHRVKPRHHDDGGIDSRFEVFWDRWQELGHETDAMTPECRRVLYPERWETIKVQVGFAL